MINETNHIKSKRLKFIRSMMYLVVLLIIICIARLDMHNFSSGVGANDYVRIAILMAVFIGLYIAERVLSRYLRNHREKHASKKATE